MSLTIKQIGQVSAPLKSQIEQFQQNIDQNDLFISQLKEHVRLLSSISLILLLVYRLKYPAGWIIEIHRCTRAGVDEDPGLIELRRYNCELAAAIDFGVGQ